jgi:phage/plasmid-associated DNA primase
LALVDLDDVSHPFARWIVEAFPAAPRVRTGSGKLHVYFRDPGKEGNQESIGLGKSEVYSVRRGNSYVVAPPSIHPDTGQPYVWEVPPTCIDLIPVFDGEVQARHALMRLTYGVANTKQGARQNTLFAAARQAWRLGLDSALVVSCLTWGANMCGLESESDVTRQIDRAREFAQDATLPDDTSDGACAQVLIAQHGGKELCAAIEGRLWAFNGRLWKPIQPATLRQKAYTLHGKAALDGAEIKISQSKAESVERAVYTFRDAQSLPGNGAALAFMDYTVSYSSTGLSVAQHNAAIGAVHEIPFAWEGDAETPVFDAFLGSSILNNAQRQAAREFIGVALLAGGTKLGRALYAKGPKGSGKSTYLELVQALFPSGAVIPLAPTKVGEKFGGAALAESVLLCVVDEFGREVQIREDAWKSAVQGHEIQTEKKYVDPRGVRPVAAWLCAGNTWPACPGVHDSFFRRWVIVEFPTVYADTQVEDRGLQAKLARERAQIMRRCIVEGAKALDRGAYTLDASQGVLLAEWQQTSDSVAEWLTLCARTGHVGLRLALATYKSWADLAGYKPVSLGEFRRRLTQAGIRHSFDANRNEGLCLTLPTQGF